MSEPLPVVQIDNGFVLDSVDLVDNGTYALVSVSPGMTAHAEKRWYCATHDGISPWQADDEIQARMCTHHAAKSHKGCGWVTVIRETP